MAVGGRLTGGQQVRQEGSHRFASSGLCLDVGQELLGGDRMLGDLGT
jgi:hypothetical protein